MRYTAIALCLLATACSDAGPTAPTASFGGALSATAATAGSALPFTGTLSATESEVGTLHHLAGRGNGTHLGAFSYSADIIVDEATGDGAGTVAWTAANGDQLHANTAGTIVFFDFPTIGLRETQTITGGTGRFATASGSVTLERSLNIETGTTAGSYAGTISLGH